MEIEVHSLKPLFDQLGLPSGNNDIDKFVKQNRHSNPNVALYELDIWNPSQAEFLKQAILEDAEWAEIVDELNLLIKD